MRRWVIPVAVHVCNGVGLTGAVVVAAAAALGSSRALVALPAVAGAAALYERWCRRWCRRVLWPLRTDGAVRFAEVYRAAADELRAATAARRAAEERLARITAARRRLLDGAGHLMRIQLLDARIESVAASGDGFVVRLDPGRNTLVETFADRWERLPLSGTDVSAEPYELPLGADALDAALLLDEWRDTDVSATFDFDDGSMSAVEFVNPEGASLRLRCTL